MREHRGQGTGSGCGRWHAGLCAPAPGGCEGCEPPAGPPPLAGAWQGARGGSPTVHHLADSPRTSHCQTPRLGLISSKQTRGCEPGQLQIVPAPVKAPATVRRARGGIPAPPAPSPGWGSPKSWHPQHPPTGTPGPPRAPRGHRREVGREEPRLIPGDPRRPHPVTLPVPLPARFGSPALVLHYFKLV